MPIYLAACPLGLFAFRNNKLLAKELFDKPEKAADKLWKLKKGKYIEELKSILSKIEAKKLLIGTYLKNVKLPCKSIVSEKAQRLISKKFRKLSELKRKELDEFLAKTGVELAKKQIAEEVSLDDLAKRSIAVYDSLSKISNKISQQLREWYGLHYPELSDKVKNHKDYSELVAKYGKRENFPKFESSMGSELAPDDLKTIKGFAIVCSRTHKFKENLTSYLAKLMNQLAPNLTCLAGPEIAARLVKQAGSLKKLASISSSSLQLLGAEKALFRHMRAKGKHPPPKHGIIFEHPSVKGTSKEKRGNSARILASKLSLAARTDYFLGKYKPEYKEELEKELAAI